MGLLVECPRCKYRNRPTVSKCKCGTALGETGSKAYWIDYYDASGRRRRERIGASKTAAEKRLRVVLRNRTDDCSIEQDEGSVNTLDELCDWYLDLTETMAKATYKTESSSTKNLKRILGDTTKLKDLAPGRVKAYQRTRLREPSPRHIGFNVRPATVNREIACLQCMLNQAVLHKKLVKNPVSLLRRLPEKNFPRRILTPDEFERLVAACPIHIQPIVTLTYYSGLSKSKVLYLRWEQVDLETGNIHLTADRTKSHGAGSIPLHPRVKSMLSRLPKSEETDRVFLRDGKPFDDCRRAYKTACAKAGLQDVTFHDLRHSALNNLRALYYTDLKKWLSNRLQQMISKPSN